MARQGAGAAGALQSFGRSGGIPASKTLWLYREALPKAGAVEELFDLFDGFLKDKGYLAMGAGRSSTQRSCRRQHNSREENETIKEGETPEDVNSSGRNAEPKFDQIRNQDRN